MQQLLVPGHQEDKEDASHTWNRQLLHDNTQGLQLSQGRWPGISRGGASGHIEGGSYMCQWKWAKARPGASPETAKARRTVVSMFLDNEEGMNGLLYENPF